MSNTEQKIWQYFKSKGLNDFGIAGLMGNLYAESGLRPTNLQNSFEKKLGLADEEYTVAVDSGAYNNFVKDGAGYGLAQWTFWNRKQNLLNFAKSKGKSIGDLDMQLDFLFKELNEKYTPILNTLRNAKTIIEASNCVLLQFERPADQSVQVQNRRTGFSQIFYDKYATIKTNNIEGGNGTMKYSKSNPPLVCMQTNSTCYQGTSIMKIKGILWHSTGANNPNLRRYVQPSENDAKYNELINLLGKNTGGNDWNHSKQNAGLNAWIGKLADGKVTSIQTMPWDYRPWGCGSGTKGSCNTGWIQFEICEDALSDKNYFNTVYKEAVELTAYLCTLYGLNPKGIANLNGVTVPVILCHADSYKLGLGSNHSDVLHWFKKYGKTMDDVRNDVATLMGANIEDSTPTPVAPTPQIYRVRKSWADAASQKGAYTNLDNAKRACDAAGDGYFVYDAKGVQVYPNKIEVKPVTPAPSEPAADLKVGDKIKLVAGATYSNGKAIPAWLFKSVLYCREIRKDGTVVISTLKEGAITGVVKKTSIQGCETEQNGSFISYKIKVTANILNVRAGASQTEKVTYKIAKNEVYTIVEEKDGWGKLKSGAGWISLKYTEKL